MTTNITIQDLAPCPRCQGQMDFHSDYPASWDCFQCGNVEYGSETPKSRRQRKRKDDEGFRWYTERPIKSDFKDPAEFNSAINTYLHHNQEKSGFESGNTLAASNKGQKRPKETTSNIDKLLQEARQIRASGGKKGRPGGGERDARRMKGKGDGRGRSKGEGKWN